MYERLYRMVDEERVPGRARFVFVNNGGTYFLTNLVVYADGMVECWGLMDFDELKAKLDSGWITTAPVEGAEASAHGLADWRFAEPHSYVDPETLIAELHDDIDQLNQRPDSIGRCRELLNEYLRDRSEENRLAAREAYLAIPKTRRRYMLGDMDAKDFPVRALLVDDAGEEEREFAFEYFAEHAAHVARIEEERPAYLYDERRSPSVDIHHWPTRSVLAAEHLAPVTAFGHTYASIAHAIFALSTSDTGLHDRIVATESVADAQEIANGASLREDWNVCRLAVVAELVRAKADQHPDFAQALLATGDGRIVLFSMHDRFWNSSGANWLGRLLEVVRSELAAQARV